MSKKVLIALLIILLLATFFRVWQLNSIPPGLFGDEALNANQALNEPGKLFYPENNGREGLFINLIAISFSLFGPAMWSFKLVSALAGILTVWGVFLVTRELFVIIFQKNKAARIGLFASFFTAVSFWPVNFSRIGFRAILVPLLLSFAFYFLFKGFRKKRWTSVLTSGLIFGLGIHTYIAYRLAVLIGAVILLIWLYIYYQNHNFGLFGKYFLLFFIGALITSAPLLMFFYNNPGAFMSRSGNVSVFNQPQPLKALTISAGKHLAMFNLVGDPNWRHNFSSSPTLFFPVGIVFLIGIAVSIKKLLSSLKNKAVKSFLIYKSLLSWWLVMLLPGMLTYEGIPHALRCIGAISPTFILAGLGTELTYQKLKQYFNVKTLITLGLAGALIITGFQYHHYFYQWGRHLKVKQAFTQRYVAIADYLDQLPQSTSKMVVIARKGKTPADHSLGAQTVMFTSVINDTSLIYLSAAQIETLTVNKSAVIIPLQNQQYLLNQLSQNFPRGITKQHNKFKSFRIE